MAKKSKGPQAVNAWRKANGLTAQAVAEAIGDRGGQVVKWLNGSRERLPIRLKVALCRHTGLSIVDVCDADELRFARDLFALMARDAAGSGAAA